MGPCPFRLFLAACLFSIPILSREEVHGWVRFPDGDLVRADPVRIEEEAWWLALHHAPDPVETSTPVQVWLSGKTEIEEEGPHRLVFRNGDLLTGTLTGWKNASIRFRTYWGEEIEIPEKMLKCMEFREEGEDLYLKGPAPFSDWTRRLMHSSYSARQHATGLEVGSALHFKNQNRAHMNRGLNNMPTRFRLQARWKSRNFAHQRHTLNLYQNRGLSEQIPNIVVNFSKGNAQVVTTSAHMRNREEYPIGNKANRQELELFLDAKTEEWIIFINGVARLRNSAKPEDLQATSSVTSFSRQLRWYSYSETSLKFEELRIEEWTAAFPSEEADTKRIPKGKAGVMLRNGDMLFGQNLQFRDEMFRMNSSGIAELPVPLKVVKQIHFRPDRWASHHIGNRRYLVSLRDQTSQLRLASLRLSDGDLSGQLAGGTSVRIPMASVAAVQAGPVRDGK